jgi:hypothetical protein
MPILNILSIRTFFQKKEAKPMLTIAAIRENPWSVMSHELPSDPSKLLLTAARLAATYCRNSECLFMRAARAGEYIPAWWEATGETPDVHEESESLSYFADQKLTEIVDLLGEDIEEPAG